MDKSNKLYYVCSRTPPIVTVRPLLSSRLSLPVTSLMTYPVAVVPRAATRQRQRPYVAPRTQRQLTSRQANNRNRPLHHWWRPDVCYISSPISHFISPSPLHSLFPERGRRIACHVQSVQYTVHVMYFSAKLVAEIWLHGFSLSADGRRRVIFLFRRCFSLFHFFHSIGQTIFVLVLFFNCCNYYLRQGGMPCLCACLL